MADWYSGDEFWARLADPGGLFQKPPQGELGPRPDTVEKWGGATQDAYGMLRSQAMGEAPSAAELQMQQGLGRAQAGAKSQAVGMQGLTPGQQARMMSTMQSGMAGQANQQAGILRAQEQAAAQQALAQFLGQQTGFDLTRQQQADQWAMQQAMIDQENAKLQQINQGGILSAAGGLIGGLI